MPRLIAEKANDGSGPVEAVPRSYPVEPHLRATPGPHSEPVLRPSFLPLQHAVADLLLETAQKHCVEHQELHPGYPLAHDFVCLGLCDSSMQGTHVSGGVSGLSLVGVLEGVRHPVVEILDCLVVLLPEVLEADAEGLGGVLRGVSFKELRLQVVPDVLLEANDVVQGAVPRQSAVPE